MAAAVPKRGTTALVTGATSGIGRETAAALAGDGATVVLGCRNLEKAEEVVKEIRRRHPQAQVVVGPEPLDLARPDSVRAFAKAYKASGRPLHILVNNAGANYIHSWRTADGVPGLVQLLEHTEVSSSKGTRNFAACWWALENLTNYLGPYTLTRLLEDVLTASAPARVINLSSVTHRYGIMTNPAEFLSRPNTGVNDAYPLTKLANVLFTYQLQSRWQDRGIQVAAVDPGSVASSIWNRTGRYSGTPVKQIIGTLYAPVHDGAAAVLHACRCDLLRDRGFNHNGKAIPKRTFSTPCRYYARGLFALPSMTSLPGGWPKGLVGRAYAYAWAAQAILLSLLDWPVRRFSRGRLASSTKVVPSAPLSYDAELAGALWDLSADLAKLPR